MKPWKDFESTVDGVEFDGREFRMQPGIYVTDVEGLEGGAEVSFTDIDNWNRAGVVDVEGRRDSPRMITYTGFVYATDAVEHEALLTQVAHVLADQSRSDTLTWKMLGRWRRTTVRRARFVPERQPYGFTDWTLTFRAPDQRVYGTTPDGDDVTVSAWGSTVTVSHHGDYPAPAFVEVRGTSASGYTITGPQDRRAVITRAIAANSPHTYDGDHGVLLVGGAPVTTGVSRSDLLEIPHGRHQFSVNNGLELRVTFPPTFLP